MTPDDARLYVLSLYRNLLKRDPEPAEFAHWVKVGQDEMRPETLFYAVVNSEEYKFNSKVSSQFPTGHHYSAVVDPATVAGYVRKERHTDLRGILGIEVPLGAMEEFWRRSSDVIARTPFQDAKTSRHRFYYDNDMFPYGDAISLRAMIAELKPREIVEIGSGFSSACMLDCVDEFGLDTNLTFVDPFPDRLKGLLWPNDHQRATIIDTAVQETDLNLYESLEQGSILFIDSTHVLKTGSDVHFELFHILPVLQPGVLIHFHDIQFPFEYPDQWIFDENRSWNEIYALRAFLMYNNRFKIKFWGSCFAHLRAELVRDVFAPFLKNPGGSIWLETV